MGNRFFERTFTPSVRAEQIRHGSRESYARIDGSQARPADGALLTRHEAEFIARRDSFYLATVSVDDWPYLQHRGGPAGFVKVLDAGALGWPDFVGNRQYVSIGNVATSDRVALFFIDYPNRLRLKVLGRMRVFELGDEPGLGEALDVSPYRGVVEHHVRVEVNSFDWNCPQHIMPRFSLPEIEAMAAPLHARIEQLEIELARISASIP